jgi:hypothetical protein
MLLDHATPPRVKIYNVRFQIIYETMYAKALKSYQGAYVQYPLSRDEHAAMARYLSGIRKQLQEVSDLFVARYGKNSNIAEMAVKALVSSTLLEHELTLLEPELDEEFVAVDEQELAATAY